MTDTQNTANSTGVVKVDTERIKALRDQYLNTPQLIDNERLRFMKDVYDEYAGYQQIIQRAKFFAHVLENKTLYIDDNLFVGSMASSVNAIYTYPEWNVEWMKAEKVVENSKTEEEREVNEWVLNYWDKRSLRPRVDEIFKKKYGYDPADAINAGLMAEFVSWPGGGGNLNYPLLYQKGIASVIKDVEERQAALDMRLPNAPKFYFYEACLISLKAAVRFANRYAELAREMAANEENDERKEELLQIAEVCEHVPEHPARNLREAIQAHFFAHICSELEQVGCGYSEAYFGQNMEPYYQQDKADGIVGPEEATYMLKHLFIKLNEISYYYGQSVSVQNSADLGQSITLGGFTGDGEDATAEMDYLILDASGALKLPQPPLSCMYHDKLKGAFLEKVLDVIGTGIGMPQFVSGNVAVQRALNLFSSAGASLEQCRRSCIGACVGSYLPYETGHPVEGQPNWGKVIELTLNNGLDPRTGKQVGPRTGDPETFKNFEELYTAFEKQADFCEFTLRSHAFIGNIMCAEFLPCTWRSILTVGCIERGTEVWNGGANYYTVAQISVGGVDAANALMAVKHLVYDEKKLSMAQMKEALDADFVGFEPVRNMCLNAPKHGNDIEEVNKLVHRVYDSIYDSFQKVGGNFISKDIKSSLDAYTKSVHNLMGLVTGALPTGKKASEPLTDGSLSAMPGTDTHGPTALAVSAAKGMDAVKYTASHMNMKLQPDQLTTRKGRNSVLDLVKTYMDLGGYHVQFSVLDTKILRDAQKNPEKYRDLVVRVAGFSAFFTALHPGVQNEIISRTEQDFGFC